MNEQSFRKLLGEFAQGIVVARSHTLAFGVGIHVNVSFFPSRFKGLETLAFNSNVMFFVGENGCEPESPKPRDRSAPTR